MQPLNHCEIAILGEAIIDMIPDEQGRYEALVGGSPYNVARAIGRQQLPVCYLSPLSEDDFGVLLASQLAQDSVAVDDSFTVSNPSSLAIVNIDEQGVPSYSLYREGIADREYQAADIIDRLPVDLQVLHTGSLAIVPEELDKIEEIFEALKRRQVLICVDLNVRPTIVKDQASYIDGLMKIAQHCDILKASDEDLGYLGIEESPEQVIGLLLDMKGGGLVAITTGASGAYLCNNNSKANREAFSVDPLIDTVGAGDCFQAGLITSLHQQRLLTREQLDGASVEQLQVVLRHASATAAINVGRKGCNPPSGAEVETFLAVR